MKHCNPAEREVVMLWSVCDALDSFVNHSLLEFRGPTDRAEVVFPSAVHRDLFVARLLDFLKMIKHPIDDFGEPFLGTLTQLNSNGAFSADGLGEFVVKPATRLQEWLEAEVQVETWLPTIGRALHLHCARDEWIYICGNAAKHNLLHLTGVTKRLRAVLERSGASVDMNTALLALPEFLERFADDVLLYHASTLAELLNNLRWGIHEYLSHEYLRSHTPDREDPARYTYRVPPFVQTDFATTCYWDIMNGVRRRPNLKRFVGSHYLKGRY